MQNSPPIIAINLYEKCHLGSAGKMATVTSEVEYWLFHKYFSFLSVFKKSEMLVCVLQNLFLSLEIV